MPENRSSLRVPDMTPSSIEIISPTSRAMGRMASILFRPFDFGKWFFLGLTAWLAHLMDGGSSSGSGGGGESTGTTGDPMVDLQEGYEEAKTYVNENLDWLLPLVIVLVVLVLVLVLVALWVSSRGKFMFLDNVVHNRALVKQPWRDYRRVGNSLFWWRLGFTLITSVLILGIVGGAAVGVIESLDQGELAAGWLPGFIALGLGLVVFAVAMAYISALLEDFVIPVMYRHDLKTTEAWRHVLSLHGSAPGQFILYLLWRLVLSLVSVAAILALMIVTCCVAAFIMIIPVVGAMVTLPITVFFRSLGPEFLRQFGPEYDLWEGGLDPFGFEAAPQHS